MLSGHLCSSNEFNPTHTHRHRPPGLQHSLDCFFSVPFGLPSCDAVHVSTVHSCLNVFRRYRFLNIYRYGNEHWNRRSILDLFAHVTPPYRENAAKACDDNAKRDLVTSGKLASLFFAIKRHRWPSATAGDARWPAVRPRWPPVCRVVKS